MKKLNICWKTILKIKAPTTTSLLVFLAIIPNLNSPHEMLERLDNEKVDNTILDNIFRCDTKITHIHTNRQTILYKN